MALRRFGIPVDRLQLPLSMLFGLKHPIYAGIILTWTDGQGSNAWLRPRSSFSRENSLATLRKSPFASVALDGESVVRMRRSERAWDESPLLQKLGGQGFVDYIATATELPDGARQVISIATRQAGGFDDQITEQIEQICPPLSLALFGIYQAQTAYQIATTYLGQHTGQLVMSGQMGRGQSQALLAAIAFIDVRNFTELSNQLGVEGTIPLLNEVFEIIDETVQPEGGEVLKFMGDAALVVFPRTADNAAPLISTIHTLLNVVTTVKQRTQDRSTPIHVGVGLHIGEVFYGNVGAVHRHDFTVMGPAVNLASRLEQLTKTLHTDIVVSSAVARICGEHCGSPEEAARQLNASIQSHGPVSIKGEPEPLMVWGIHRN